MVASIVAAPGRPWPARKLEQVAASARSSSRSVTSPLTRRHGSSLAARRRHEVDELLDPAEEGRLKVGIGANPAEDLAPGCCGIRRPAEGFQHPVLQRHVPGYLRPAA